MPGKPHSVLSNDDTLNSQQYPILHSRFKHAPPAVAPRERYRSYRRDDAEVDCVEDDWGEEGMEFDAFDEQILQQSMEDRKKKAEKGLARLSFASKFRMPSYKPRGGDIDDTDDQQEYRQSHRPRKDLSQFAFNPSELPDYGSDYPSGHSSSPAFRASQRRAEHDYTSSSQPHHSLRKRGHETSYVDSQIPQESYESQYATPQSLPNPMQTVSAVQSDTPVCQGISLVFVSELPPRLRTVFPYPNFNAVQSKCFEAVYKSDNNFVLAAPTGSGKTVILELAICRAISTNRVDQYKIVYQAPTKALCSERQRDWERKFTTVGLKCAELTGDSDAADLKNVQSANIIITTPEKWDSITRKWKDHEKLMRLIKLFLIDEAHILNENRGATLEAIVSRMKSIGTDVRFVALSATVPNFSDVATWLGKSAAAPWEPAVHEKFGEEFRPVKLQKYVCGYTCGTPNDFAFEKVLDSNLAGVIRKYSEHKPIMIFCNTRASTATTAKKLAHWWTTCRPNDRMWDASSSPLTFRDKDLQSCAASGVAFHHAGISLEDRIAVQEAYLKNHISIICCTSTLAVGVNLPCHMVIIKNTVVFGQGTGFQEYSDLDIMQMLGRAGRPQFEDTAVAVIMTRQSKVAKYDKMVTGEEVLESTLHQNLVDHLNAEICLGTIKDLPSANRWLASTFLYVRLSKNSGHYKLDGSTNGQSLDEQLDDICFRDISLLRENELMEGEERFRPTEFGQAMTRYCVHFKTMQIFMGLPRKATPSEMLSAIAQASEFEAIRFRQGEKSLYKHINKSVYIRFPIPVDLALSSHKISLLIQSVLGAADIPWDGDFAKHKVSYNTEAVSVFRSLTRLIRCIIDCQIVLEDAISINNALMLERSIAARVWDDSPSQMKQIDKIGTIGVRKLAKAGIRSIEELECTEPHRIESIIGRNPPFGLSIIEQLKNFPKLRISLSLQPNSVSRTPEGVKITVKADIGFINEKVPHFFGSRAVYVCMLAETSDGRKVHFARTSSRQLGKGQLMSFTALLTSPNLSINAYLMCDGIAGTQRCASVTPKITPSMFPPTKPHEVAPSPRPPIRPTSNMGRRRIENATQGKKRPSTAEEYDDGGIDDEELMKASSYDLDFDHIENFANTADTLTRNNTARNASKDDNRARPAAYLQEEEQEPRQLENGKWACNHSCKNKLTCKHFCCKEGMDKPPKKTGPKRAPSNELSHKPVQHVPEKSQPNKIQTKLQISPVKRHKPTSIEELDLTKSGTKRKVESTKKTKDFHASKQRDAPSYSNSIVHKKPKYCYGEGGSYNLSFMNDSRDSNTSDYGDMDLDDVPYDSAPPQTDRAQHAMNDLHHFDMETTLNDPQNATETVFANDRRSDSFGDDDSVFGEAMLNFADDSGTIGFDQDAYAEASENAKDDDEFEFDLSLDIDDFNITTTTENKPSLPQVWDDRSLPASRIETLPPRKARRPFLDSTSSPKPSSTPAKPSLNNRNITHRGDSYVEADTLSPREQCNETQQDGERHEQQSEEERSTRIKKKTQPDARKDLSAWLLEEFGDVVEIVDE